MPWIDEGITQLSTKSDAIYRRYKRTADQVLLQEFRTDQNRLCEALHKNDIGR